MPLSLSTEYFLPHFLLLSSHFLHRRGDNNRCCLAWGFEGCIILIVEPSAVEKGREAAFMLLAACHGTYQQEWLTVRLSKSLHGTSPSQ